MKRKIFALCTVLCTALFFISCSKDNTEANASLMIVNASPNGANIDAAVNGSVIVTNMAYPANSGYKSVTSGTSNVTVSETGSTTTFLNGSLNLEAGSYYTLYVTDSANKRKATVTKDDLTPPSAGKAKIRLLHLSPNAPAVDITATSGATSSASFNNRSFNDVSTNGSYAAFTEIDAGPLTVTVKNAGSSTVLANIPTGISLQAGKIYTVIIKGFVGGTASQALGVEVITHN